MTERLLRYRENIAAACPELAMETAELFRAGQNNDLILVNGELIFRFPKYRQGIARLGRERAILNAVRGRLPLATPDYIYHNVDEEEVGRAFVGYRKLPGSSLWSEEFAQISDEGTIDRLATDVASFLQTLHATPLDSISMPLGPPDSQAGWQDMFSRIREVVYPHLTAEARRWTTERFAAFLEDDEHFAFSKVLRHGDFGTSNTLYSSEQRRVVGIIDFGHAGVGDAVIDFAGLCVSYGEPFLKRCARVYPLMDQCWERIRFYANCAFLLEDALFCVEHDLDEAGEVINQVNKIAESSGRNGISQFPVVRGQ